jgi:PhzF family phenazine biosynthesis protein
MLQVVLVEAFAGGPCRGNGAAVVRLEAPLADPVLQGLATSLNQSETAFLWRNDGRWILRWFTPSREVPLCGHATLAACVALGQWGLLQPLEPIQLFTRSGPLPVELHPTAAGQLSTGQIELPMAVLEADECPVYLQRLLLDALGSPPVTFWRSQLGYAVVLVEPSCRLNTMASLASQLKEGEAQGLVVMQALGADVEEGPMVLDRRADYQLRFFAPGLGIPEDPVTGSAHALVAPYWMQICSRSDVVGWQCSPRPGGMVCERVEAERIQITGSAYLLLEGTINLDAPPSSMGWMLP